MKKIFCLVSLLSSLITNTFAAEFTLESPAFKANSLIPVEFTCDGKNKVPPLTWSNAPTNTQAFALVLQDPDAPEGVWTHWILYNIPPTVFQLDPANPVPQGASMAKNSWKTAEYRGPCPPIGMHQYVFTLYALDKLLILDDNADTNSALDAMTSHVIGTAKLEGLYQK